MEQQNAHLQLISRWLTQKPLAIYLRHFRKCTHPDDLNIPAKHHANALIPLSASFTFLDFRVAANSKLRQARFLRDRFCGVDVLMGYLIYVIDTRQQPTLVSAVLKPGFLVYGLQL